jgi:hypothetical protein
MLPAAAGAKPKKGRPPKDGFDFRAHGMLMHADGASVTPEERIACVHNYRVYVCKKCKLFRENKLYERMSFQEFDALCGEADVGKKGYKPERIQCKHKIRRSMCGECHVSHAESQKDRTFPMAFVHFLNDCLIERDLDPVYEHRLDKRPPDVSESLGPSAGGGAAQTAPGGLPGPGAADCGVSSVVGEGRLGGEPSDVGLASWFSGSLGPSVGGGAAQAAPGGLPGPGAASPLADGGEWDIARIFDGPP